MNCNELVIGDWVYVTSVCGWECNPIQQQIRGIEYNSFKGDDYCDWVSVDCDDEASLSHIEPIPLTAEILKKNNFCLHSQCGYEYIKKTEDSFDFRFCVGGLFQEKFKVNMNGRLIILNYVHELQHVLRLCGLNDFANNFKI